MSKITLYLVSFILLSTVMAKAMPTAYHTDTFINFMKYQGIEQIEKIDLEKEERITSQNIKNSEFISSFYHHQSLVSSSAFLFNDIIVNIPLYHLEIPEMPPKTGVIFKNN
ncbi:MAG: hypothetical protein ACQUHE_02250 [Bacteroidia bacterium]